MSNDISTARMATMGVSALGMVGAMVLGHKGRGKLAAALGIISGMGIMLDPKDCSSICGRVKEGYGQGRNRERSKLFASMREETYDTWQGEEMDNFSGGGAFTVDEVEVDDTF